MTQTVDIGDGVQMPLLGFGTWQATGRDGYESTLRALEIGYRHIDTATMYGNEAEVGRALHDSGVPRDQVFLTTKLPPRQGGRAERTLEASLAALGTDHVDLWLIHWPPGGAGVDIWRRFVDAKEAGKARAVGVSNYDAGQLDELAKETGHTPAVNQIPWSPAQYDAGSVAEHRERGVVLEGYSPFKGSDLRDPVLSAVAREHGVTVPQVILRWHIQHGIVVIPKSVHPERIAENFDVYGFELTPDEMDRIDALGD